MSLAESQIRSPRAPCSAVPLEVEGLTTPVRTVPEKPSRGVGQSSPREGSEASTGSTFSARVGPLITAVREFIGEFTPGVFLHSSAAQVTISFLCFLPISIISSVTY